MVVTSEEVPKASETTEAKPKKKRQRNRPRNKRNRFDDNESSTSEVEQQTDTSMQNTTNTGEYKAHGNAQEASADKTREQIMAEREAKKQAKQAKKQKTATPIKPATTIITEVEQTTITTKLTTTTLTRNDCTDQDQLPVLSSTEVVVETSQKTRDQIKAEREAKKAAKQAVKVAKSNGDNVEPAAQQLASLQLSKQAEEPTEQEKKKPTLSKAERRAVQEAQRAAKAQSKIAPPATAGAAHSKTPNASATPVKEMKRESVSPAKSPHSPAKTPPGKSERDCNVKLFNHLVCTTKDASQFINNPHVHPSMARLGEQYVKRIVVGSNARCIAFLNALRQVVQDFETPAKKEFGRSLDVAVKYDVDHLHKCRPLAVSVSNAYKQFKNQLTQLPADKPETELKELLTHFIDTYVENQIGKAAQAISSSLQEKITDGDVLLTFGCSSLIHFICEEAKRREVAFRVIVVDSRPFCAGQEMLRRLHAHGIPCTYVLINAISYVMPEATKVLLGAHALLANGYVMARTGTAQVALVAHAHNVPVLVCCETHKFSERFQTDAIVYNELGDPNDLIRNDKCCLNNWQTKSKLTPLNLNYDITPPELVSAVVTEVAILPCTSVPVILRIKPDIGY